MLSSRRLLVVLAAVCALLLAGCGKDTPPPPPAEGNEYVGLGDSFTAVSGAGPYSDEACKRGVDDYPSLLAEKLGITSFADVSCGGAQTKYLTQTQSIPGEGVNQAQLDAVSPDTKLVTIGMGLNDAPTTTNGTRISFLLLYTCLPDDDGKVPDTCNTYLSQPVSGFDSVIDAMADNLTTGLEQIRQQAPDARIVVVGYPRVAPDSGSCPKVLPYPPGALERIRVVIRDAGKAMERVAKKQGADYVDMWSASKGHDACSDAPWVNGAVAHKGKALEFHPYKSYHRAVADEIAKLLENDEPRA